MPRENQGLTSAVNDDRKMDQFSNQLRRMALTTVAANAYLVKENDRGRSRELYGN
jgi:hypothetical protein